MFKPFYLFQLLERINKVLCFEQPHEPKRLTCMSLLTVNYLP